MFRNLFSRAPDPASVPLEAFAKAVRAGEVSVVDVRESHEFASGRIPGSVNLPLSRFDPEKLPHGRPADGHAARSAERTLQDATTSNITPGGCPNGARMAERLPSDGE